MKTINFLFLMIFATANIYSQTYTISFAATGAATTVDSVKVENLTHTATVKWHAGDIFHLVLSNGINDFDVSKNLKVYPNPMQGQAEISFYAKQTGNAKLSIYDIAGKEVLKTEDKLLQGTHKYQLTGLKQGMYFINISGYGYFYTAKLISQNATYSEAKIKYIGNEKSETAMSTQKSTKAIINMAYIIGDSIRFTGYTGSLTAIVNDVPTSSKTITFAFTGVNTVLIPAGTFTMGSPTNELYREIDETQYQVTLSAFRMSKYEITNAQYAAFLNAKSIGSNGLYTSGAYPTQALIYVSNVSYDWGLHYTSGQWVPVSGYENHPLIYVTWYGATEFATYVGGSLPTEAQWEYACRGNTTTPFNTGNCLSDAQANYDWAFPYSTCTNTITTSLVITQVIGSYAANTYGLYDMQGNVWEWCSDWYGTYLTTPQTNPTGATTGSYRVLRGGSWYNNAQNCRSASRSYSYPNTYNRNVGFRIALVP